MKNIYLAVFIIGILTASCGNKTTQNSTEEIIEEATGISDENEVEEIELEEFEEEKILEEVEE